MDNLTTCQILKPLNRRRICGRILFARKIPCIRPYSKAYGPCYSAASVLFIMCLVRRANVPHRRQQAVLFEDFGRALGFGIKAGRQVFGVSKVWLLSEKISNPPASIYPAIGQWSQAGHVDQRSPP